VIVVIDGDPTDQTETPNPSIDRTPTPRHPSRQHRSPNGTVARTTPVLAGVNVTAGSQDLLRPGWPWARSPRRLGSIVETVVVRLRQGADRHQR
jgi:hypothetical protein